MNRENIQKVRDHIAGLPRARFNMARFVTSPWDAKPLTPIGERLADCGTAGCIAGWALFLCKPEVTAFGGVLKAAEALGLTRGEAEALFAPDGYRDRAFAVPHAVRVLDHLLATGEVDWKSTRRAKKAVQS